MAEGAFRPAGLPERLTALVFASSTGWSNYLLGRPFAVTARWGFAMA